MKIFKNGQEFVQESLKEIEFSFCFYLNVGLREISSKDLTIGISSYINSFKNTVTNWSTIFHKFELVGEFYYGDCNYDLIKATYSNSGVEKNLLFLGKFNDGVINIKDHNIEIIATKKDFETKKLKPISLIFGATVGKLENTNIPVILHDRIKEIHCHEKVLYKSQILDLIIIKWVEGYVASSDTSVYYGHFNDGVL